MLKLCTLLSLLISVTSWAQNHQENFAAIKTIEQAEKYAKGFREVFTGIVHQEKDVFFFDNIDTSKLDTYIGSMHDTFGKKMKLVQDSIFNIVNVQVIKLDFKDVSPETAEILTKQMGKLLARGDSYWDVKKRFSHTSAKFSSSPKIVEEVTSDYAVSEEQMISGEYYKWEKPGEGTGFVIVDKEPHLVPGFFTISFLDRNSNF